MGWKLKKMVRDEKAQASLFDAVMFFILMLIASSLIFIFSTQAFQTQEVLSREDMMRYTDDTMEAILQSTINYTWYYDIHGDKIEKTQAGTNIIDLLVEELALLDDGVPKENFTDGYEKDINITIDKLVGTSYDYVLQVSFKNTASDITYEILFTSGKDISEREIVTSQWSVPMISSDKPGDVNIKLSISRA
jgi:hypothetical protein